MFKYLALKAGERKRGKLRIYKTLGCLLRTKMHYVFDKEQGENKSARTELVGLHFGAL